MIHFILLLVLTGIIAAEGPPEWMGCGQSKYEDAGEGVSSRIVGGKIARRNEFPWMVSLRLQQPKDQHFCGGSILNRRWLLTAAHCVNTRTPEMMRVAAGDHRLSEKGNRTFYDIEKIVKHPKFNHMVITHDIALIKIKGSFKMDENVWPICAPEPNNPYEHYKSYVSGWGKTSDAGEYVASDFLRYTKLNTTTQKFCEKFYKKLLKDDMICATDNQNDLVTSVCGMDSGGPLAVKGMDGRFSLVGVVSLSNGCATGSPSVYVRVNYVLDWITHTIKK